MTKRLDIGYKEAKIVRDTLISAGFLINEEKSVWIPFTSIVWLGIAFNSTEFSFKNSENRSISLKNLINKLLSTPYATPQL